MSQCDWSKPRRGYVFCRREGCANRMRWMGEGVKHNARCKAVESPRPWEADRLAVCRACPHYVFDQAERCGLLVEITKKAGLLMHPKGVPNPKAKCPDGRWCEVPEGVA